MNDDLRGALAAVGMVALGAFVVARHAPPASVPAAVTSAAPQPQRAAEHRKLHRTAPKIATRKWEPLPKIKPIPPIMKEERRRDRAKKPRSPTASQCARLRNGIAKYGSGVVRIGARAQGYTDAQLDWAIKQCGI